MEVTINLDKTPPSVAIVEPAAGTVLLNRRADIGLSISDNLALDGASSH
ncbi:hypothetical protein ACFQH7_05045 [Microbulbifer taiwanensis]